MTIKQILVPTDFSETSQRAFEVGASFAKSFGARLNLLHVIPDPYSQPWSVEATGSALPNLLQNWEVEAQRRLDGMKPSDLDSNAVIKVGDPYLEIVKCATDQAIDLIVIGTHGRGPIGHMLLGSVAEKVVRKAPCPVMTVRHPDHEPDAS